jgi:hypothetical protein
VVSLYPDCSPSCGPAQSGRVRATVSTHSDWNILVLTRANVSNICGRVRPIITAYTIEKNDAGRICIQNRILLFIRLLLQLKSYSRAKPENAKPLATTAECQFNITGNSLSWNVAIRPEPLSVFSRLGRIGAHCLGLLLLLLLMMIVGLTRGMILAHFFSDARQFFRHDALQNHFHDGKGHDGE